MALTITKRVVITRMRGIAIRCVEANVKVNGSGQFSHPHPSKTPQPISMSCQIYYYVPKSVDVQNLVGIDSAVTDLRMREKTRFCVDFLLTYLSVYLSVPSSGLQVTVLGAILTLNGLNDVISQPLVPFGVTLILLPTKGVKSPKNPISGT